MTITPYQFMIVGSPGRGKTYSFRNMNTKTCGFINMEGKPLPFINKFEHYYCPNNWQDAYTKLIEYAKDPSITEIVFDSFSAYMDSVLKTARETKKGFDVWNLYNEEIGKILYIFKKCPKDLFSTSHYEWIQNEEGAIEKRIKVKGKEWEGMIEKEFTIVMYTDVRLKDEKREYYLKLNTDGKDSAKCPPIFLVDDQNVIPNDSSLFLQHIRTTLNNN
jgi:hypothetical protein